MKLIIIDNYDSFTYNLVQLVEQAGNHNYVIVKNDELMKIDYEFDKILISPGPGVSREAGELLDFLNKYYETISILGICLGYEAIGELFGARLSKMKHPMHGIQNKGEIVASDKIFENLPNKFDIGHYHSWIINEVDMPDCLDITMKDENNLPMAFKHTTFNVRALMFHPESVMTEYGREIISNWLAI